LLYNNALVSYHRNYLNELYIIKSYPLINSVLDDLNFDVAFYREGNFLVSEAYEYIPVKAHILDPLRENRKQFIFTIVDDKTFELKRPGQSEDGLYLSQHPFGYTITCNGMKLFFEVRYADKLDEYKGVPFILSYTPTRSLTGSYVSRLNASWAEE